MAEQQDLRLLLEANNYVEDAGRLCDLLSEHGVRTVEEFSALSEERLREWGINDWRVYQYALPAAQSLTRELSTSPHRLTTVKQQLLYGEKPLDYARKKKGKHDVAEYLQQVSLTTLTHSADFFYSPATEDTQSTLKSDKLCGAVQIAGEKVFYIDGKSAQLLDWGEYGLQIRVPEGVTSGPCDITVKAITAGEFEFPEGTQLASALYAISVSRKLDKPVQLEMQHCVVLKNEQHCHLLQFVRAKCNQPELPYKFSVLKGGIFDVYSRYGNIGCEQFSIIGIVLDCTPSFFNRVLGGWFGGSAPLIQYYGQLFYFKVSRNTWEVTFSVTRNTDVHIKRLREFHENKVKKEGLSFTFDGEEKLVANINSEEGSGWSIFPKKEPFEICKSEVDSSSNESFASLFIQVHARNSSEADQGVRCRISLEGIKPKDSALIMYRELESPSHLDGDTTPSSSQVSSTTPQGAVKTSSPVVGNNKRRPTKKELLVVRKKDGSRLKIMSEITSYGSTASEDLATLLLGDDLTVRKLRLECKDDNNAFVRKMFDAWLNQEDDDSTRSTAPCTWEELCQCVEDTPDLPGNLVKEIRDQLCS